MLNNLEKDYLKCEEVIKKNSKSFYKAFSQLEDEFEKKAIYSVYAYCRYSDDVTDNNKSLESLDILKNKLDLLKSGVVSDDYIFRTLNDVSKRYYPKDYDFKPFYDMLLGHKMDLENTTYNTLEELEVYCRRVASSVGEMLIYILAPNGDINKLMQVSNDLGIAMQLTNILRDVGEDFLNNRVYLPREIMNKFGLTLKMIEDKKVTPEFINTFEYISNVAVEYYDKAYKNLHAFPKSSRMPLTYALVIYREILNVCKEAKYDVLTKRNKVSDLRKIKLIKEVNSDD